MLQVALRTAWDGNMAASQEYQVALLTRRQHGIDHECEDVQAVKEALSERALETKFVVDCVEEFYD